MKNISILLMLAVISIASSCSDDEAPLGSTTTVNLNLKGVYDTDPLVMINKIYKYPDGKQILFQDVNFFISEVVLVEADGGDEVELLDIEFVNFAKNSSEAEADIPITFNTDLVPVGNYSAIKIGIGVPADLNNSEANQFGENHPLRKNFGQFWSGWDSFIFTLVNGQYDANGDGIFEAVDPGFNHHLGSDPVFKTITVSKSIVLEEGSPLDLNLIFDLQKLYGTLDDHLDLTDSSNLLTHSPDDLSVANYMTFNFEEAITFE